MKFDLGQFDLEGFDQTLITSVSGLILLKCANWTEGTSHGGTIGTIEVASLFDDITEAENVAGLTDYRKAFIKATESDVLTKTYTPVLVNPPESISGRITLTIAAGTADDTMTTKPADESFDTSLLCDIYTGESQPVWIKRTITGTETLPAYLRGVQISLMVSGE
jgi:hypothetical protein